jgi:signal transduction histidine kinase/ActR/RegA family two-component response regulator
MVAQGDGLHVAMGALTVVFGVVMAGVASNTHRAVTQAFRLRFENHDLLDRLSRAQTSLADANRTLEERVAERSAALERQTETLREAQRMESVGLLAGGVAHDFNNLLTAVMGNVELLLRDRELSADKRESLAEIQEAARRGANLVSQLLAFSRRQVAVRRVVDLNAVVTEAQRLLGRLIGEDVELAIALRQGPLPVMADPTQLHQIIINLATNARDAMPGGGKLTIETAVVEGGTAGVPVTPGTYAMLSVQDTGTGMDAETRRMAFHPFFTTKEVGRGTGLGLATVYGIVEQCGGRVFVESAPGKGSCFRVFLPYLPYLENAALEPEGPTPAARRLSPARRSATVLLAEDEPLVRSVTARVLTGAGFVVIEAENGEHALELARRHAGAIDLLVSDTVMPKLGGVELARRLSEERPGTPVLLVSGYNREGMSPAEASSGNIALLQKPFAPQDLVETALRLLAGPAAPVPTASVPSDIQAPDAEGEGRRSS